MLLRLLWASTTARDRWAKETEDHILTIQGKYEDLRFWEPPYFLCLTGEARFSSTVGNVVHCLTRFLLHIRQEVTLEVERYRDGRVTEHLLNDLWVGAIRILPNSPATYNDDIGKFGR